MLGDEIGDFRELIGYGSVVRRQADARTTTAGTDFEQPALIMIVVEPTRSSLGWILVCLGSAEVDPLNLCETPFNAFETITAG